MSEPLTEAERAYRRGCLQAVEAVIADLLDWPACAMGERLAQWRLALQAGRDSEDAAYLGTYLRTVQEGILE